MSRTIPRSPREAAPRGEAAGSHLQLRREAPQGRDEGGGPRREDLFAVLGLPRAFALEPAVLDARVRDLSRRLHPDRFARAPAGERAAALARATRVNDARRVLRDWPSRAAHLLELAGHAAAPAAADPELLERQLELRERLEDARDPGARAAVAAALRDRLAGLERAAREAFADPGWTAPGAAGRIARLLAEARFVERALGAAGRASAAGARGTSG